MPKRKKLSKEKKPKNKKIKIRIKSATTKRSSWKPFEIISIDDEGWIKIKGITKPHFYLHKDIHKNHIKRV
jgi:hypothetical protein